MSILDRINNRKKNQQIQLSSYPNRIPLEKAKEGIDVNQTKINQSYIPAGTDTRDWRKTSNYDDAVKIDPNLSRSQYISGVSQYRKDNNLSPFSDGELYSILSGKDPFISASDEKKQENRIKIAEGVNAIGNVLANLVNYMRTRNGYQSMNLQSGEIARQNRIDKLKAYQDALAQSNYNIYLNAIQSQREQEAANAAAEREFQEKLFLENMKNDTPLARAQARAAEAKAENEIAKKDNINANTKYSILRAKAQELENSLKPQRTAAEIALIKAKTDNEKKGGKSNKKQKNYPKVYLKSTKGRTKAYDLNNDDEVVEYYNLLEKARGLDSSIRPETVDKMREFILTTMKKYYDTEYGIPQENLVDNNISGLGWGKSNNNNNNLDW